MSQPTYEELLDLVGELSARLEAVEADNAALARAAEEERASHAAAMAELQGRMDKLVEKIMMANARHFCPKADRVPAEQLSLFNDAELCADPREPEPTPGEVLIPLRPRRRGGKRRLGAEDLEVVVAEFELPKSERTCPVCAGELAEMKVEVTRVVRLVPAHLIVEERRRHVYRCSVCCKASAQGEIDEAGQEIRAQIVRAPKPADPIPGSFATPSLIAHVLNSKYVNSMPLYRTEAELASLGMEVSRATMANWVMGVWKRWFSLVFARMRTSLLSEPVLHMDETPVQVLREPDRSPQSKSYVWLTCAAEGSLHPCFTYDYRPSRSGACAREILAGWSGTLVTDGYPAYFSLEGVSNVACLAHVRRKFTDVMKAFHTATGLEAPASSVSAQAVRRIDALLAADRALSNLTPKERARKRTERVWPLAEELCQWAGAQLAQADEGSQLYQALAYAVKHIPYTRNAAAEGRAPLTNNLAERAIKPFVMGRKNWLFSNTPRGAEASCGMYSIVVTAKANGLVARKYMEWVLTEMPGANLSDPSAIDRFLPWSNAIPDYCRASSQVALQERLPKDDPIVDVDPADLDED